jgi:hypothetical protein
MCYEEKMNLNRKMGNDCDEERGGFSKEDIGARAISSEVHKDWGQ